MNDLNYKFVIFLVENEISDKLIIGICDKVNIIVIMIIYENNLFNI